MIRCCLGCPDRNMDCHSTCEKYISEKAEYDREKEEKRKARYNENNMRSYLIAANERMKGKRGGKRA